MMRKGCKNNTGKQACTTSASRRTRQKLRKSDEIRFPCNSNSFFQFCWKIKKATSSATIVCTGTYHVLQLTNNFVRVVKTYRKRYGWQPSANLACMLYCLDVPLFLNSSMDGDILLSNMLSFKWFQFKPFIRSYSSCSCSCSPAHIIIIYLCSAWDLQWCCCLTATLICADDNNWNVWVYHHTLKHTNPHASTSTQNVATI